MRITSTLNNIKLKYLYSWIAKEGKAEFGQDVLVSENGKIIRIEWLRFGCETILW